MPFGSVVTRVSMELVTASFEKVPGTFELAEKKARQINSSVRPFTQYELFSRPFVFLIMVVTCLSFPRMHGFVRGFRRRIRHALWRMPPPSDGFTLYTKFSNLQLLFLVEPYTN